MDGESSESFSAVVRFTATSTASRELPYPHRCRHRSHTPSPPSPRERRQSFNRQQKKKGFKCFRVSQNVQRYGFVFGDVVLTKQNKNNRRFSTDCTFTTKLSSSKGTFVLFCVLVSECGWMHLTSFDWTVCIVLEVLYAFFWGGGEGGWLFSSVHLANHHQHGKTNKSRHESWTDAYKCSGISIGHQ